jgi:hypothetical protein
MKRPVLLALNSLLWTSLISNRSDEKPMTFHKEVNQFRVFAVLWAIATLFHLAHSNIFNKELNLAALTVAAFVVLFRPRIFSVLGLILLQIFDAFLRMPYTTNHWIFTAFVNATVIYGLMFCMVRSRSFRVSEGEFYNIISPVVRVQLIVLYFFVVFHKLNSGFFAPETSCASELLQAQTFGLFRFSEVTLAANAYFAIVVEALIPLALCFRATRTLGVLVGLLFHTVLAFSSYNPFYDFSSMLIAAYFLFLPPSFTHQLMRIKNSIVTRAQRLTETFSFKKIVAAFVIVLVALLLLFLLNKILDTQRTVNLYFFWTAYCILCVAVVLNYLLYKRKVENDSLFAVPHWSFAIFITIVFLNGICPYIGLKTENSFAMFSNLRTEGGESNHFLVPVSAQIFDFQRHAVIIHASTDPGLQKNADEHKVMVAFAFRRYINDRKPEYVAYSIDGIRRKYYRDDPRTHASIGSNNAILHKLMGFRSYVSSGEQPCAH